MSADDPRDAAPDPEAPRVEGDRVLFRCATCGKELRTLRSRVGQTTACPQCGDPVTVPDTGVAPPPPPAAPAAPRTTACPMCGAENSAGAVHCAVCGERLPQSAPSERAAAGGRFRRRVGTVSLGETFREGNRLFGEHLGLLLGGALLTGALMLLGGCLIGMPFQFVGMAAGGQFADAMAGAPRRPDVGSALVMTGVNQVGQLAAIAVLSFLLAGYVRLRINLARRGRASIEDLFAERGVWASAALTTVVYTLMTSLPSNLAWAVASAGDGGAQALGFPAMVQPGPAGPGFDFDPAWTAVTGALGLLQFVLAVLFWPYLFLCVDYKMSGLTPLSAAWETARGSRWALAGLSILQGVIMAVAAIPCGLGLLLAIPYVSALNVAAYEQISGNHAAGPSRERSPAAAH
ncbi:zinc-ribbon domain-containing protein [Alienimonas sp. DA493]|uniref:zinc-ribbon domain-containing protein n=1 Tax=Alienimonas sp. DA493 TaxID=3373605 RepID=UPI0037544124